VTPTPSDAQPVAPTKPRCAKPGCGALHIVGHPCTDWDCPQQYVSAADYRAVESALDAERQKREAAEQRWREMLKAEHDLSAAYVRLRSIIPGALDTKFAPTAEEIWTLTEQCATALVARVESAEASLAKSIQERDEARQAVDAFAEICDELGVERDNEAGLIAAHALVAELASFKAATAGPHRYHLLDEHPFEVTTAEGVRKLGAGWLIISEGEYRDLAKANARIAELEAGWRPIETAPRDGTPVLVTVLLRDKSEAVVGEAHFEDRGDRDADTGWWWAGESPGDEYAEQIGSWHFPPSLWRPLPVPGNITNIEKERDDA
jgi:hypothetical protein